MTIDRISMNNDRPAIGIWAQWPDGSRWTNEGMTRLLGFLVEGIAQAGTHVFRIVLPDSIRDAAESDLRTLNAKIGRDFTLHSPRDYSTRGGDISDLPTFANQYVNVEGWLSLFPNFAEAGELNAPITVIFPDAIPKVFHQFGDDAWGEEGAHLRWENDVRHLLERARAVVTFSNHVAREHVGGIFNFPADRLRVVSHAAPDLKPLLPFMDGRQRTQESLRKAAEILREECRNRNNSYLGDFPFEEVPYVAVSTQDRVTKNIQLIGRAIQVLVRERRKSLKLLTTAPLSYVERWAVLPKIVKEAQAQFDVVSIPDLPRQAHAAFLHCASLAVHPSIYEGGHAPFPFYEAVSVGTPCIMALGPHIAELVESEPSISQFCFDSNDCDGLADLICKTMESRVDVLTAQQDIYSRLQGADWSNVARNYASAALSSAHR